MGSALGIFHGSLRISERAYGLGFYAVQGMGSGWGFGFRVLGFGFEVWGLGFFTGSTVYNGFIGVLSGFYLLPP